MELTEDELFLMRTYAADSKAEMEEMLENSRHFASDSFSSDLIRELMRKLAYLSENEFAELMKK